MSLQLYLQITSQSLLGESGQLPPVFCGHFLSVVTISHFLAKSFSSEDNIEEDQVFGVNGQPLFIRVYMKQEFVVEGLLGILNSPGSAVYIRDIAIQQNGKKYICKMHYSYDNNYILYSGF